MTSSTDNTNKMMHSDAAGDLKDFSSSVTKFTDNVVSDISDSIESELVCNTYEQDKLYDGYNFNYDEFEEVSTKEEKVIVPPKEEYNNRNSTCSQLDARDSEDHKNPVTILYSIEENLQEPHISVNDIKKDNDTQLISNYQMNLMDSEPKEPIYKNQNHSDYNETTLLEGTIGFSEKNVENNHAVDDSEETKFTPKSINISKEIKDKLEKIEINENIVLESNYMQQGKEEEASVFRGPKFSVNNKATNNLSETLPIGTDQLDIFYKEINEDLEILNKVEKDKKENDGSLEEDYSSSLCDLDNVYEDFCVINSGSNVPSECNKNGPKINKNNEVAEKAEVESVNEEIKSDAKESNSEIDSKTCMSNDVSCYQDNSNLTEEATVENISFLKKTEYCIDEKNESVSINQDTKPILSAKKNKKAKQYTFFKHFLLDMEEIKSSQGICEVEHKLDSVNSEYLVDQIKKRDAIIEILHEHIKKLIIEGQNVEGTLQKKCSFLPKKKKKLSKKTQKVNEETDSIALKSPPANQENSQNSGFVFIEESGMYYDYNRGCYYDHNNGLYFDVNTRTYFYYDNEKNEYVYHSHIQDESSTANEEVRSPSSEQLEEGEYKCPSQSPSYQIDDEGYEKSNSSFPSIWEVAPALRIVVMNGNQKGMLHIVTKDGGFIGSNKENIVHLDDPSIEEFHAEVTYSSNGSSDHHYFIQDLGSHIGTLVNQKKLQSGTVDARVEIAHKWKLKCGNVFMTCHIHPGYLTCNECDPSLTLAKDPSDEQKIVPDMECERRRQMKVLRKKYALSYNEPRVLKLPNDRAKERRTKVGSDNPYEKTEMSSVHQEISGGNKGFKLLKQMGWEEGQGLGLSQTGKTEPIPLISNDQRAGLGFNSIGIACQSSRKQSERARILDITKKRLKEPPLQNEDMPLHRRNLKIKLKSINFQKGS